MKAQHIPHTTEDGVLGKLCYTCGVWKPLAEFGVKNETWDTLQPKCLPCLRTYQNAYNHRDANEALNFAFDQYVNDERFGANNNELAEYYAILMGTSKKSKHEFNFSAMRAMIVNEVHE